VSNPDATEVKQGEPRGTSWPTEIPERKGLGERGKKKGVKKPYRTQKLFLKGILQQPGTWEGQKAGKGAGKLKGEKEADLLSELSQGRRRTLGSFGG